jgi:predicted RND superfamily exporter protein
VKDTSKKQDQPVIRDLAQFDHASGSGIERLLFNNRLVVAVICVVVTVLLGYSATRVRLNASFESMIPTGHGYIKNYLEHRSDLKGLGNSIRIAVETDGTIYDDKFLNTLQKINDEVFLLPGVDRPFMKSLWTANTRWIAVTEDGIEGGAVIPDTYNGSQQSLDELQLNVSRSGEIGQLVAPNRKSAVIFVPLLSFDTDSGKPLDYAALSDRLEKVRRTYETQHIHIHIIGFAKVVGDLIAGLKEIMLFFAAAILITAAMLYWYTRCVRSTALVVVCSLVAVVWQLGLLPLVGFELDPYSVLVPFLVFAIGMSHGAQKMNGIMQDIGRGTHRVVAARYTFRRLFLAGLTALLCDAVGFAVLTIIKIRVIQELAAIASIGVAALIFTNLILLPILLSYVGVSGNAARRGLVSETSSDYNGTQQATWRFLGSFTNRRNASIAILVAAGLAVGGYVSSTHLKIGDLDAGAPELRPDSRYNRDNAFITKNYGASSDVFAVMVKTPDGACANYDTLMRVDALEWQLRQVPGVESTSSLASISRNVMLGMNEGSPKWYELLRTQSMLNSILVRVPPEAFNQSCNLLSVFAYLKDHKADTLLAVASVAQRFADENDNQNAQFLLAAGNAGIQAATNAVVKRASNEMLYWVYGAVIALCLLTFRSWRAVVCAVLPLMLTSILCEALMVWLNIGVKVSTLPVIALGVGIGVDYALYVMSVILTELRLGKSLPEAYDRALRFTGKVVLLTGFTLAAGVATWGFSPIKFQADMGILLAFMFVWNMVGALVLLPALAHFLLPQKLFAEVPREAIVGSSVTSHEA